MSGVAADWAPRATPDALRLRAAKLAALRQYFAAHSVLEVDTPALVNHAVTDVHLHSFEVTAPSAGTSVAAAGYLHTSPEYAMKRLLAAGSGDIYQLCHVFRAAERGALHNAEFMMAEWYRLGWSMERLMAEVAEVARLLLDLPPTAGYRLESFRELFLSKAQLDPLECSDEELRASARQLGLDEPLSRHGERAELFDALMSMHIGPALGHDRLCFVHHYPATQAALARLDRADPRTALRFELYYRGVELANGFEELADASEQRARFEADSAERRRRGLPAPQVDRYLLAALEHGLPPCAGVALGVDRCLMIASGATHIEQVLAFTSERA